MAVLTMKLAEKPFILVIYFDIKRIMQLNVIMLRDVVEYEYFGYRVHVFKGQFPLVLKGLD